MRPPLFIVAPPRSYTSVVGGMLGQHPQAYGLPEVNLSQADTLGDLWDARPLMKNFAASGMSGLLRLLAELHEGTQTEEAVVRARRWILRRLHWPTGRVLAHIQEAVGPDRMLIDKSPRNTIRVDNMRRLLRICPDASFLHLTRHPRTQSRSLVDLMKATGLGDSAPDTPERTWLRAQTNILEFAAGLATGQYMRIKGETLLRQPHFYLGQICDWLDLDAGPDSIEAMLHPETSPYACFGPPSAPFGNDPNFLEQPVLDFDRLARIKEPPLEGDLEWQLDARMEQPVKRLARQFGYA